MSGLVTWFPLSSTGVRHAYGLDPSDPERPACGQRLPPAIGDPEPVPLATSCRTCAAVLRSKGLWAPSDPGHEPHEVDALRCACTPCRKARHEGIGEYLTEVRAQLEAHVGPEVLAWWGAEPYVRRAESRLEALCLSWELSGAPPGLLEADLDVAEDDLHAAWCEAREAFELLSGPSGKGA